MRPLKFRVWNKKFNTYLCPLELSKDIYELCTGYEISDKENYFFEQYTGLKDKTGKEIYEGDIVKIDPRHNGFISYRPIQVVSWSSSGCWNIHRCAYQAEIIGNIHQNGDLLCEKNK